MAESPVPGEAPVSLNEARSWLRLGATVDDAVVAGLVRAATNICEAFVGQWLVVRAGEEEVPLAGASVRLTARPVVAVDGVALIADDGEASELAASDYRVTIDRGGTACVSVHEAGDAVRVRIVYRAGMAAGANGIPEAIRQGILRMTQHLHEARENGAAAPPAMIAALWQPWRRLSLGGER